LTRPYYSICGAIVDEFEPPVGEHQDAITCNIPRFHIRAPRRRTRITQAEIQRVIRAGKKEGAVAVDLKIGEGVAANDPEIKRLIDAATAAARKNDINIDIIWSPSPPQEEATDLYRLFDEDGQLLYVGMSCDVWRRQADHRNRSDWYELVVRTEVESYPSRYKALLAEREAIQTENPIYNAVGRVVS
jgi:hypothetical protein